MKLRHILMAFAAGAALLASCDELQEFIDDHQDEINDVINSEGDGSLESPYNAVAAIAEAKKLGWNSNTDYEMAGPYYIKGVVSEIKKEYQANYGTAIFSIADKEDSKTSFLAYGLLYLDNKKWQEGQTQIKVGDEVILYGQIMNYKGETPETVQNQAYLYSLNGVTENTAPDNPNTGDETDYENAPEISISEFLSLADSATVYKLTGIVKGNINATYGNFNLYEEDSDVHVYIYGVAEWDKWKDKVAEGCKVTLAGKYFPYQNASGSIVQEIKDAHILAVEEGAGPEPVETEGDGTLESPYTVNDITSLILSGNTPSEDVFIEGTISAIRFTFDANYGTATFWISADGVAHGVSEDLKSTTDPENDFLCYSVYTLGGEAWVDGYTQIAVGDDVIICGKVTNYNGLPETSSKNAYIYSLNGVIENGDPQPQQEALEVTVAEFLAAETSETQAYQLTGKIANLASTVYGNFDLVDETGSVYVYGLTASELGYGAKNDQSFATLGLAEGDTIVIIGYRYIYTNNNTGESKDEVAYAWFVEKLASGDPVQVKDPVEVTVAEFLAAPESKDQPYKLTGTVEKLENTTYGNFDLVDETGSVYVYGLTATDLGYGGSNDKSFESLGIEEGDKIIIIGYRGVYNDTDEVKFAYLVENLGQDKPQQELYGDGTLENPYLPSDAIAVASALEVGEKTEDDVYVIGYIATIKYT
ncbi:MAG: hypothetical protein J5675_06080, partial [Bacteroidales bacterium]|nr:hypothetical protein [Bacteroidales bacterium]